MVQAAKGTRRTGPGAPAGRKILASAATKKKSRQSDSLVANGRKKTVSVAKVTFGKKLRDFVFPPKQAKCAQQRDPTLFEKRVYVACSQIPPGQVSTYGNLAAFLNSSARAVGGALRKNPYYPIVPCHRVVASTMELGGFNGTWGAASPEVMRKKALLKTEGVKFDETKSVDKGGRITKGCFFDFEKDS